MIRCHSEGSEAATQPPQAFGARPGFQSPIVAAALWAAQTLRIAKRLQQSARRLMLPFSLHRCAQFATGRIRRGGHGRLLSRTVRAAICGPSLCQGVGFSAAMSRSGLCSSAVWLVALLALFLDLWCVLRVVPVVVSPVSFTVCFVLLTTVSPVPFVFSATVCAVSFVFSAAVSTPSLTVSPAFFAPCFTS